MRAQHIVLGDLLYTYPIGILMHARTTFLVLLVRTQIDLPVLEACIPTNARLNPLVEE